MDRALVSRRVMLLGVWVAAAGALLLPRPLLPRAAAAAPPSLPFHFERNDGQAPKEVDFLSRGREHTLFLGREEAVLALGPASGDPSRRPEALRMRLSGSRSVRPSGGERLPGRVSYFLGSDPQAWQRDVPTYGNVTYAQVYAGIDLVYHGTPRAGATAFEYDFVIAPGGEPSSIAIELEGPAHLSLDENGDLVMRTTAGELRQHRPVAYQEIQGERVEVPCAYRLSSGIQVFRYSGIQAEAAPPEYPEPHSPLTTHHITFALGPYDRTRPLVIDPVLVYSTLLGGSGPDGGFRQAVDASGALYVAGTTSSLDFPVAGPFQGTPGGLADAFVAKLDPTGSTLQYATYLGGLGDDIGGPVDLGSDGSLYFAVNTRSVNFPTTPGAADSSYAGDLDVALARLSPNGTTLLYSSYYGGTGFEFALGIDVAAGGEATVTGETNSTNLPSTPNVFQAVFGGEQDAFMFRLNPQGTALVWSTYAGGSGAEFVRRLASDSTGALYITGTTYSSNLPTTPGALRSTWDGAGDAYVLKLSGDGRTLLLGTFLGGTSFDYGQDLLVDPAGAIYVSGSTESGDFPVTPQAFQRQHGGGGEDAFVAKLNPGGDSLAWATFVGGSGRESFFGLARDATGNVFGTGSTSSANYPVTSDALQAAYGGGGADAMLTRLNAGGTALRYSTFLGGPGDEDGVPIAVDAGGRIYLTGHSSLAGFPTTAGAFQQAHRGGGDDAFAVKLDFTPAAPSGVFISASGSTVTLLRPAGGLPVEGLRIERRAGSGPFSVRATIGPDALPFVETGPVETPLTYRVFALDGGLSSAPTELGITPLRAPSGFGLAARTETSLRLKWQDNSSAETGYQLEQRSGSGPWEILATLPAGRTTYTHSGLGPFQTFTYRLKAVSQLAASLYTSELTATTDSKLRGSLQVASSFAFGNVPVRTRATRLLALTNTSHTERLRVDVSRTSSPFGVVSALQVIVNPGETKKMTVSFQPTQKRGYKGELQLTSTDPRRPRVRVALSGHGT